MEFNRSILILIILLTFFEITKAQRICPLDGNMALLYLEKKGEVIIKTKHAPTGIYSLGGIHKFKYINGVIHCKMESYDSSDYGQDYFESNYFHYPEFIKIRNNGFLLSNKKNDSLVVDSKGHVVEVYRKENQVIYVSLKYRYLNDTTVLETSILSSTHDSSNVSIYELDHKFNLKAIKDGEIKSSFFTIGVGDIEVFRITKFEYDKNNTKVNNIETYDVDGNKTTLQSTHTFVYKNNKPVKSYVFDTNKKAVVYEQIYLYR